MTLKSSIDHTVAAGPEVVAEVRHRLNGRRATWLVTGVAGFIGSHLAEVLLALGQRVVGLDNLMTGQRENLRVLESVSSPGAEFLFIEGDIREAADCARACEGVDYVLHQAALGSVPRSIQDPVTSHAVNVDGFLRMLIAARDAKVRRFIYASSSSVYGDHPALPKREESTGNVLSPYAATKRSDEHYASAFAHAYGMRIAGLRYFNVFGPRQDPSGPYAAVIPRWLAALSSGSPGVLHGDGETSRDFCYVANAILANIAAALSDDLPPHASVFNVACGEQTSLRRLYEILHEAVVAEGIEAPREPERAPFRPGDIRHSLADISQATHALGYVPLIRATEGLRRTAQWYLRPSEV